jgi:hypothetical protein
MPNACAIRPFAHKAGLRMCGSAAAIAMVISGAGLKMNTLSRILVAWLGIFLLTILVGALLYCLRDTPSL